MPCACKALLYVLAAKVLTVSIAARTHPKVEKPTAVLHVIDRISALLQTQDGTHEKVLDNLRTLAAQGITPGATESLHDALSKVMTELENNVEAKIKKGHDDTQAAIDAKIEALNKATTNAVNDKSSADEQDSVWFKCVEDEKAKRVNIEEAEEALRQARESMVVPCQQQEDRKMFRMEPNAAVLKFLCDISTHGNCDEQLQNYRAQVGSMVASLRSDAAAATQRWADAKAACDQAKADVVAKQTDLDSASAAWEAQRQTCMAKHESAAVAVCVFGAALQRKCGKVAAYMDLIAEVDRVNGGEYSHPDRVKEWQVVAVTKCMISKVVGGDEIDGTALDACEKAVSFEGDVGELNKQEDRFAQLTSSSRFTCQETTITFGGTTWAVPQEDEPASSQYVVKPFHPEVNLNEGTAPFSFCGGEAPAPAPAPAPLSFQRSGGKRCAGRPYTYDTPKGCKGWGGLTEQQCWEKCATNAQAPNCPARHCAAMVFYPDNDGHCHLFDSCPRLDAGGTVTYVKEESTMPAAAPDTNPDDDDGLQKSRMYHGRGYFKHASPS